MGIFEAIIIGLQFKRLQKPLVFVMMLVCIIFFGLFGLSTGYIAIQGFLEGKAIGAVLAMLAITTVFLGLCVVCGNFIKKCVR